MKRSADDHWDGCEHVHLSCALAALDSARVALDWNQELVAEAGSVVSLARATIEALPDRTLAQDEALQGLIDWEDRCDAGAGHPEEEDETRGR